MAWAKRCTRLCAAIGRSVPGLCAGGAASRTAGLSGAPVDREWRQFLLCRPRRRPGGVGGVAARGPVRPAARLRAGAACAVCACRGKSFAPSRKNSRGVEFGDSAALRLLRVDVDGFAQAQPDAQDRPAAAPRAAQVGFRLSTARRSDRFSKPIARRLAAAITAAHMAFFRWSATAVEHRAKMLVRVADDIEAQRGPLIALLQKEAGKTLDDALAEVREAADLCRYYAAQAKAMAQDTPLPGPTGEENHLRLHGRGVFVCISPWNFPLAIFIGQVAAALVTGNAVVAKPAPQTPLVARKSRRSVFGRRLSRGCAAIPARRRRFGREVGVSSSDRLASFSRVRQRRPKKSSGRWRRKTAPLRR